MIHQVPISPGAGTVTALPSRPPAPLLQTIEGDRAFLAAAILFAFVIRFDFLLAGNFIIDSDEAIVGLMGKHILEGRELPTFYYGQHYMGSLEAILAAFVFAVCGVSNVALQVVPLAFSLILVPVVYLIGYEIGNRAVARSSALLMALPPVGLVVWSTKARGGFIEVVFLGAVALLLTLRWLKFEAPSLRHTVAIGVVLGIGWWVNNQIIYFIGPIGLFCALRLFHTTGRRLLCCLHHLAVGIGGFFLGGAPFWIYQLTHDFASFGLFSHAPVSIILQQLLGVATTGLPILLGAKQFWENHAIFPGASALYYFLYGVLLCSVAISRRYYLAKLLRGYVDPRRPVELLFVLLITSILVFSASSFGWLVQAPRYLLPLYVALFPLIAVGIDVVRGWTPLGSAILFVGVFVCNALSSYLGGRALPGEPIVFNGERVAKSHSELIGWLENHQYAWVRTNYWIGYRLAFETRESVRFRVINEPRTIRIPSYYIESEDIPLETMPLVLVPSQATLTRIALQKLGFLFKEDTASGYVILYDISRGHGPLKQVPRDILEVSATRSPEQTPHLTDGRVDTRWGTAEPQQPGEEVVVTFAEPQPLSAIEYSMGKWETDYPRKLSIFVEHPDGSIETVVGPTEYEAVRYYLTESDVLEFHRAPVPVRKIILRQLGTDEVFDWSIAELRFFTEVAAGPAESGRP